jgi:hypothetical protein
VQRRRVRDLRLDDVIVEFAHGDVEPLARDDPPFAQRVQSSAFVGAR